jgi:hypothetical protein
MNNYSILLVHNGDRDGNNRNKFRKVATVAKDHFTELMITYCSLISCYFTTRRRRGLRCRLSLGSRLELQCSLWLLLGLSLIVGGQVACSSDGGGLDLPTRYESTDTPQIKDLIRQGRLQIVAITPLAAKLESSLAFGKIIKITIASRSSQPESFRIDCGTILRAQNAQFQDLIVSTSAEGSVNPQATWEGTLDVYSLQLRRAYPYQPAQYTLGNLASGDLRKFLTCFCLRPPIAADDQQVANPNYKLDFAPVQYAVWNIADRVTFSQIIEYARGRGNASPAETEMLQERVRRQSTFTQQLLTDCEVNSKFIE